MADCGVYVITSPSGKQYVGSSINIRQRWGQHLWQLNRGAHHNSRLQAAWDKYGAGGFTFTILNICNREDLMLHEQRAIDIARPQYNILRTAGSFLGHAQSDEHRAKISAALKGKPNGQKGMKRSAQGCANISASLMGHPGFMKGKKHTAEARRKISAALKGKKACPIGVAKMAASLRGRKQTDEHRANISKGNKGKRRSEEQRKRYSAAAFLRWKRQHAAE